MTTPSDPTIARRLALSIVVLNGVLLLAKFALGLWFSVYPADEAWLWSIPFTVTVIVYSVFALLIISRFPSHAVGWLFLIVSLSLSLVNLLNTLRPLEPSISFGPVGRFAWWAAHVAFIPAFSIPISLVLLLFPDGRLPTRRWWPVAAASLLGICGVTTSIAIYPWPWEAIGILDAHNPFEIAGTEQFLTQSVQYFWFLIAIGVLGSLAAVVVRFYRARSIERLQMKWLVYTVLAGFTSVLLLSLLFGVAAAYFLSLLLPSLMAIAIGAAILRHRLFDIDVIIRRTLVYGALTAVLGLFYFGSVLLLQQLSQVVTGQRQSSIVTVVSTLASLALFSPLRLRIQRDIDRRFYRQRYDAEETLRAFAQAARDETDLDNLTTGLLRVVRETIQPSQASLWLFVLRHQDIER